MAGKIIADTIESAGSQISLNVGNVTILTASSTGLTLTPTTNVNINLTNSIVNLTSGNVTNPSLTFSGNTSTGIYLPTTNAIAFVTAGTEDMRIDASGRVGIGTASPGHNLTIFAASNPEMRLGDAVVTYQLYTEGSTAAVMGTVGSHALVYRTNATERMRIDSSGRVLVGTTSTNLCAGDTEGIGLNTTINGTYAVGAAQFSSSGNPALNVNRKTDDGNLVTFSQAGTSEGTISVSGTTVSYNGGHLSRWAQTIAPKDDTLVKGTVLSNLDEMNVYTDADGNPVDNEQLNKVKVSDVEGDANIAGVFVNWLHDDAHGVDEINMAMTGDMIIRIAQGVTVHRGDLLMSAGDGTAKPQGDDIVRSKTVAKVTSTHVTCTYADGSFCVPCVMMAC
jgi:hypothetical protein